MSSSFFRSVLGALFFTVLAAGLHAQESSLPDIVTDRPSVGTGPETVPLGSLQAEHGLSVMYTRRGYVADLPESLIRLGAGSGTELRFTASNAIFNSETPLGEDAVVFQDISIGLKRRLASPNHGPLQAVMVSVGMPTGGPGATSGSYDPAVTLIGQQVLSHGISLTENVQALMTSIDGRRRTNWLPGLVIAGPATRTVAWYLEYAPTVAMGGGPIHIVDGGLTRALSRTSQVDFRAGYQKDGDGGHNILSIGYSRRLDGLRFGRPRR